MFSSSGRSSFVESAFLRGTILGIDVVNASGGIGGRPIEIVYRDPKCDPRQYPAAIRDLVLNEGVTSIFGCVSSLCRKAAMPMIEKLGAVLWYPTQFEGFEHCPNILYGGQCPNQYILPLFNYLYRRGCRRFCLIGTDSIFPRETLRVFRELAQHKSVDILDETYLDIADERRFFEELQRILRLKPDTIVSAVAPPALSQFFRSYQAAGGHAPDVPIAAVTASEIDMMLLGGDLLHDHIAVGPYFETMHNASNDRFLAALRRRYGLAARGNMRTESAYDQVLLFARAAELANDTELDALLDAVYRVELEAPQGTIRMDARTNCTFSRPRIGVATRSGQYVVAAEADEPVEPDPFLLNYQ